MSARGQKFTVRWKTPQYYSDFQNDFATNPMTGALATLTNDSAIDQAIRNLVMTRPGSRPGRNSLGSKVMSSMFDLAQPATLDVIQSSIENVIANHEPRAENVVVTVDRSPEAMMSDTVTASVTYQPVNLPQTVTLIIPLRRVR